MPRRLKALRPFFVDTEMAAAGLIGSWANPLLRIGAPTVTGSCGSSAFGNTSTRPLDAPTSSSSASLGSRRPSSAGSAGAGVGRNMSPYTSFSGQSSMTYASAARGAPDLAQPRPLSIHAPEFVPRANAQLRSLHRLLNAREPAVSRSALDIRCHALSKSSGSGRTVVTAAAATASAAEQLVASTSQREPAEGMLVEYLRDTKRGLALLVKRDGKRNWTALDTRGITYSLRPTQIAYVLPGSGYAEDDLHSVSEAADKACSDEKLMELAWQVVSGSNETYDVIGMADLLFGKATVGSAYAAHRLLNEDRTYFKQTNRLPPRFQARPEPEVRGIIARREAEERAAKELTDCVAALRAPQDSSIPENARAAWLSGPHAQRIKALEAFALQRGEPRDAQIALETLQAAGLVPGSGAAADLLGRIGVWNPHDNIGLRQLDLTSEFPPALQEAATALLAQAPEDPDAAHRVDLMQHDVVTIDDASTTEVDDGLSVEFLPDGRWRLWVHVADPTRWLQPGTPLDLEARRRGSTMYLPTGAIFMFPGLLAEGPFSLRQGEACCALSFGVELTPEGDVAERSVVASRIVPTRRMTYDEVDAAINSADSAQLPPDLQALLKASELRQQWRVKQGAITIALDESEVRVSDPRALDPTVTIERLNVAKSPARSMVAEMMILAGQVAATIGNEAGLALPYRGQAKAVLPPEEELAAVPEGVCRDVLIRSRMVRGVCTTHAAVPHAGLGLPGYVQVTSPIRRYTDLVSHWQLKKHIRGETPHWDTYNLGVLVDTVTANVREHITIEREVTNYWLAKYFEQQRKANPQRLWAARLLHWIRQDTGLAQVQLEDEGLETVVRIDRPAQVGERLQLSCSHTDARSGLYRLEEAYRGSPLALSPNSTSSSSSGTAVGEQMYVLGEPGEGDEDGGSEDAQMALEPSVERAALVI